MTLVPSLLCLLHFLLVARYAGNSTQHVHTMRSLSNHHRCTSEPTNSGVGDGFVDDDCSSSSSVRAIRGSLSSSFLYTGGCEPQVAVSGDPASAISSSSASRFDWCWLNRFDWFRFRRNNQTAVPMMEIAATPPTTPPVIVPTDVELDSSSSSSSVGSSSSNIGGVNSVETPSDHFMLLRPLIHESLVSAGALQ